MLTLKDKKKKYEPPVPTRVGKKKKKTKGPDAASKLPLGNRAMPSGLLHGERVCARPRASSERQETGQGRRGSAIPTPSYIAHMDIPLARTRKILLYFRSVHSSIPAVLVEGL